MERACRRPECTVTETGKCLLNNDPETCAERHESSDDAGELTDPTINIQNELSAVLESPKANPRFPTSFTLSPADASTLMAKRYCRIIGILGAPDAGKTASLVSLYLLCSQERLDGFTYCDSRTLIAFEDIARGARRWNDGKVPEQMTSHTELADERTAGFLHLRLRSNENDETLDLLLPDLPGEWTNSLIDQNRVERLNFLKSADVLWIMLDGRSLIDPNRRMLAIHRARLMIQRLATLLGPATPPTLLVVTRRDSGSPSEQTLDKLTEEAASHGVPLRIVQIASFADDAEIAPGTGISDLLRHTANVAVNRKAFWPDHDATNSHRSMLRFRNLGAAC